MLKMIGVLLVVTASTGLGFSVSRDLKLRIDQLHYLRKLMLMLQGEIKYVKAPLPEAFASIGRRSREPFQAFFAGVAQDMDHCEGETFQEIWDRRIREDLRETRLTKTDLESLRHMGENIGYLDHEMQLGTLGLYTEQLENEIHAAEKVFGSKSRIYHCLGVMGGIFIAILIL